jgi:hypothetical protein
VQLAAKTLSEIDQVPHSRQSQRAAAARAAADIAHALASPGHPLDVATRERMEPRFGQDFSQVRIHSGDAATVSRPTPYRFSLADGFPRSSNPASYG